MQLKRVYSSFKAKMSGLLMKNAFKNIKESNPDVVGGAIIGIEGILVKAHGSSDAFAFSNGIRLARELAKEDMSKVRVAIEALHNE